MLQTNNRQVTIIYGVTTIYYTCSIWIYHLPDESQTCRKLTVTAESRFRPIEGAPHQKWYRYLVGRPWFPIRVPKICTHYFQAFVNLWRNVNFGHYGTSQKLTLVEGLYIEFQLRGIPYRKWRHHIFEQSWFLLVYNRNKPFILSRFLIISMVSMGSDLIAEC